MIRRATNARPCRFAGIFLDNFLPRRTDEPWLGAVGARHHCLRLAPPYRGQAGILPEKYHGDGDDSGDRRPMIGGGSRNPRGHRHDHQDISTYIAAGYSLASKYDTLDITSTGGVGGFGVQLHSAATLDNYGRINASGGANGVRALSGATITNGSATLTTASISLQRIFASTWRPRSPISARSRAWASFGDGVFLTAGGAVTNEASGADTVAYIGGDNSAFGGRRGHGVQLRYDLRQQRQGVYLKSGGSVTTDRAVTPGQPSPATLARVCMRNPGRQGHQFGTIRSQENGAISLATVARSPILDRIFGLAAQASICWRAGPSPTAASRIPQP